MTRWLIVPVLCALAMPSTASAQAPSSPPADEGATEAPQTLIAPAEGSKAAEEPGTNNDAELSSAPPSAETAAVTPAPPPPPQVVTTRPPPTGPKRNKRAEPLLVAGLSGFATVYLLTAYVGAATIDKARDIRRGDSHDIYDIYGNAEPSRDGKMTLNRGRALIIPVAGPFIAMHFTNSARRKYWQAVNGGLQAGTLAMAIIGSRMYAKHRRAKRRAQVTASASPQGAQVGMSMRF